MFCFQGMLCSTTMGAFIWTRPSPRRLDIFVWRFLTRPEDFLVAQDLAPILDRIDDHDIVSYTTTGQACHRGSFSILAKRFLFPQIAGSYRGSYFSKIGLLIPTIATCFRSHCMISILCCSWLPLPPAWSPWLPLQPCLPSFVSLHDLHSGLLSAAPATLPPLICPSLICPPAWSPLGCRCRLVSLHLSPCMISILGCSWLSLPCLPSFFSLFWAAALSPFICPPAWSSFVPLHDLLLAAVAALSPFICLPAWSPFWAALGVSLHLSPCMISILGCSWLPLPPCLPSFVSLHDLHSGLLLPAVAALSPFICLVTLHSLSFVSQLLRERYLGSMPV